MLGDFQNSIIAAGVPDQPQNWNYNGRSLQNHNLKKPHQSIENLKTYCNQQSEAKPQKTSGTSNASKPSRFGNRNGVLGTLTLQTDQ